MADHSKPLTTSTYANFVTELDARFDDLTIGLDPALVTPTNLPTNAIRWTSASNKWQKWNGTAWGDLSSSYAINISGSAASLSATLVATSGGTGQSSYAIGDLLYASTTTALSKLAGVATGNALISGGVNTAPSWGKIGLTTHVTGTLGTANGGTGSTATAYCSLTTNVSGTLPIANGGTNSTATPTNGGVGYGTGTAYAFTTAGTAGQALLSAGAASPVWTTLGLDNLPDAWVKKSVKAATTADLAAASSTSNTITGTLVVFPAQDGITLALNDRLLVKNQATASQNGIYRLSTVGVAGTTAWVLTRTADADSASEIAGGLVSVDQGTVNGGTAWDTDFKSTDTIGTTAMSWNRIVDTGYTIPATQGGTGQTTYAVGDLLYASTTSALSKLADVATGNALISGGIGVAPAWGKIGLTTHISGTLAAGNGGTGQSTYAIGDLLYASTTSALSKLAAVATGSALISQGVGVAPIWGQVALGTGVSGQLPVANGGTGSATADAARVALNVISSLTGSQKVPAGTTAQRDASPAAGWFRYNTTLSKFEGYNGSAWGSVGGGATGGGSDDIFVENGKTVTTNYTITTNKNAMSAGPITINTGVTVTVPTGSTWVIV